MELGHEAGVLRASWPEANPEALTRDTVEVAIQLNGKLRGKITIAAGLNKVDAEQVVRVHPYVTQLLNNAQIVKVIIVPDRLANIVVRR